MSRDISYYDLEFKLWRLELQEDETLAWTEWDSGPVSELKRGKSRDLIEGMIGERVSSLEFQVLRSRYLIRLKLINKGK